MWVAVRCSPAGVGWWGSPAPSTAQGQPPFVLWCGIFNNLPGRLLQVEKRQNAQTWKWDVHHLPTLRCADICPWPIAGGLGSELSCVPWKRRRKNMAHCWGSQSGYTGLQERNGRINLHFVGWILVVLPQKILTPSALFNPQPHHVSLEPLTRPLSFTGILLLPSGEKPILL